MHTKIDGFLNPRPQVAVGTTETECQAKKNKGAKNHEQRKNQQTRKRDFLRPVKIRCTIRSTNGIPRPAGRI